VEIPENERIVDSIAELIGRTPLIRLHKVVCPGGAEVLGKLEYLNPGGSVKDRTALSLIEHAEREGKLSPGATIIEPTSGNTGISLAMLSARRGYRCMLVMPDDMSLERRYILRAFGAELVMTAAEDGMAGAVRRAESLHREIPGSFMPQQFKNPANPEVHFRTTGPELWRDTGGGRFDALLAGVGTGGTLTGTSKYLRSQGWQGQVFAIEPKASPVLSGGKAGLHAIQGIGAGFIPEVLDRSVITEIIPVADPDADKMVRRLAREEGLLLGVSAGAAAHAACQLALRLGPGKRLVVILPDSGERYLF
jgi:cysteine synthase A